MTETFRSRVTKFWKSFSEEESLIREMIENKADPNTLVSFVNNALSGVFTDPIFEMGKNNEGKFELILSPNGNRATMMQLYFWYKHAPQELRSTWNFYYFRPAQVWGSQSLQMYDIKIESKDLQIYPASDNGRKKIDLEIHCPQMMGLNENQRYNMLFIYLDRAVSELYTMEYVGHIDFVEKEKNAKQVSINELKTFIDKTINENEWEKYEDPTKIYSVYKINPTEDVNWLLRQDVMVGQTSCMPVVRNYYNEENSFVEFHEKEGVHFGFLFMENSKFPEDSIVACRGEIEDKILEEVEEYSIASLIGGATGFHFSYSDFIIYDKPAFLEIVKNIVSKYNFEEAGYSDFILDSKPVLFKS